ncbi:MAG TPA: GIDE domain-containing protein [Anaerolineales bacterium]|nr:GIDE domain-containing protein [Anaerolineales bacterium]
MDAHSGGTGGFVGLLLSYKDFGKLFRMIGTSTGEIAHISADEQVEIVGKADSKITLHSPITKTPCVLWQVAVMEKRSSGRSSRWVTVYSNTSTEPFDVYDATGRMRIQPNPRMELHLRDDVKKSSGLFTSLDEQTQAVLSEMGVSSKGLFNFNKNMRVHERFLEQGDQVYVLGRTSLSQGARVMDGENHPLIVSDQSELRLLGRFLWRVIGNVLIFMVIAVLVYFYFVERLFT